MVQLVKLYRNLYSARGRWIGFISTHEVWQLDVGSSESDWRRVR